MACRFSRVEYLHQLARCCPPPELVLRNMEPAFDEALARKNIGYKLQSYKRTDAGMDRTALLPLRR